MLELSDLSEIADARRGQGRMYDLPHVLLCCILAVAAGAGSYRGIARFIEARFDWLQLHTGLTWRQAPTHTGLRAILLGLDQDAVEQALRRHAAAVMVALSEQGPPGDVHHHDQIGQRNRIESRPTSVWPLAAEPVGSPWKHIRCLVRVRRHTELFDTAHAAWHTRGETAWYVCTTELSARAAAHAVRNHWLIENALHHVRDVAMGEDASRIRRQPGVFAQLRTWSLNLLRQAGHHNISAARQTLAWSEHALLNLFGNS